jgi:hypothetical protein
VLVSSPQGNILSIQSVGHSPCSSYQRQLGANEIDQLMQTTLSVQNKISSIRQSCIYLPSKAQNTFMHHILFYFKF